MRLATSLLFLSLELLGSTVNALPIYHGDNHDHQKREIVTRMHTAATQTVTDFYSTTTNIVVAPTVEFVISGTATYTTTLLPDGVDPTIQPSVTLTTTLALKQAEMVSSLGAAGLPSNDATSEIQGNQRATTQDVNSQQTTQVQTTQEQSTQDTEQSSVEPSSTQMTTTVSPTTISQITSAQETTASSSANFVSAIGNDQVQASVMSQPPVQAHTSFEATATSSSSENAQPATSTSSSAPSETSSSTSDNNNMSNIPVAVTYSPYNSDGTCRSSDSIYNDLRIIKSKGISQVRIYGTDCNSLQAVQPACSELGIKINQGFWISSAGVDSIDGSVASLIEYGQQNGWDIFEYITIGNEAINSGFCSVSDLISKIASVKSQLRSAGYSGRVTTSEPPVSYSNYPELCTDSAIDFVGINPHSYFNSAIDASGAGSFIKGQLQLTQRICGTDDVVITETGYPSRGNTNGRNVPSAENQRIAVQSILDELDKQVTILSYFDDLWKDPGSYGIEQSFGIESLLS